MKKTLIVTLMLSFIFPVLSQARGKELPKRTVLTVKQAHSILVKQQHSKHTIYKFDKGYGYANAVPDKIKRNWYCFDIIEVLPNGDAEESDIDLCVDKITTKIFEVQPGGKYKLVNGG